MKHWRLASLIGGTLLIVTLLMPAQGHASTAVTLNPTAYATLSGADGGQSASVLATRNQTGSDDNPAAYLTLTTPGTKTRYSGYRIFFLPGAVDPATITSIQFHANYRGPGRRHQVWSWSIYNWAAKRWVGLGSSAAAVDGIWSPLAFTLKAKPATFKNFVGPVTGEMLVMVGSNNGKYDAALDYEAVIVSTSADVTLTPPPPPVTPAAHTIWQPAPGTTWQWQLDQPVDTSYHVQMYDVDLFETPQSTIDQLHADGRTVICYFSAGTVENWRPDASQFPAVVVGRKDSGWAGENWLDVRQIGVLAPIMTARLDLAVAKGCDGVEPDNLDAYTNGSGFPLTAQDQLTYDQWLATEAHNRYLSVGLKNDIDQVPTLVGSFDWALNEQCYQYDECDAYQSFVTANKAVFGVEYTGDPAVFCPLANAAGYSWLKKHLELDAWVIACR